MRRHLADQALEWSPLNAPFTIDEDAGGVPFYVLSRRSDRVLIYGAGLGAAAGRPLLEDPDWEVWGLNLIVPRDSLGRVRADVWWDLHQRHAQSADDLRWIARCPRPLFVPPDLVDAGPTCVPFPLARVEAFAGRPYWACTFAYQIAYAVMAGYREIGLYGIELAHGTRRERTVEWACVSYWVGWAEAHGVTIRRPEDSRLGRHPFRYGFEYDAEKGEVEAYLARTFDQEVSELYATQRGLGPGASVGG